MHDGVSPFFFTDTSENLKQVLVFRSACSNFNLLRR